DREREETMGRLVLCRRDDQLRYLLEGENVVNGSRLEVRLPSGDWLCGRVRWDGDAYHQPTLTFALRDKEITIDLPANAELRRPSAAAAWNLGAPDDGRR